MYIYIYIHVYIYILYISIVIFIIHTYTAHVHIVALVPYLHLTWNGSHSEDCIFSHRYARKKNQVADMVLKYQCCYFWLALCIL